MSKGRIRVTAVFVQEFYEAVRKPRVEVELPEGARVRDLIDAIDRSILPGFRKMVLDDEGKDVRHPVEIAVNGRRIDFLEGLDTVLRDGDRVLFSPRVLFVV